MKVFPGGKKKAVTFSYDDGIFQDIRLIEIMDKYGLKGTFNVNFGLLDDKDPWVTEGIEVRRLDKNMVKSVFKNHEIACHGFSHPNLAGCTNEEMYKQLYLDRKGLENLTDREIKGLAYPFGGYSDEVIGKMKEVGILYGRTVETTGNFNPPKSKEDFYRWKGTCHHNDNRIFELIENFKKIESDDLQVLYIWGHSYEFDVDDNWVHIENIAKSLSGLEDVWYATNMEVYKAIINE